MERISTANPRFNVNITYPILCCFGSLFIMSFIDYLYELDLIHRMCKYQYPNYIRNIEVELSTNAFENLIRYFLVATKLFSELYIIIY